MAIITQYRTWKGIQTKQEVNTETGVIEVFAINSGILGVFDEKIARSDGKGNDWEITNSTILRNEYNKANKTRLTKFEVEKEFIVKDYKIFNNDRAAVLNNPENFDSPVDYATANQRFFDQKMPGIKNPKNGQEINSEGNETTVELEVIPFTGNQTETGPENVESPSTANGQVITGGASDEGSTAEDSKSVPTPTPKPKDEKQVFLRYPLANLEIVSDLSGITYDYIKITVKDWVSAVNSETGEGPLSVVSRYKETKKNHATIILPMTNGLGTQNGINWGENNTNSIMTSLGASIGNFLTGVSGAEIDQKLSTARKVLEAELTKSGGLLGDASNNSDSIAQILAGMVIGNTSIATRQSGTVINPNMELLFGGPQLRSFGFRFDFAPRFEEEAKQVREIIKTFKKFSAPVIEKTGGLFLKTPKIFELEYIYTGGGSDTADGESHPYLNKIKPCALTNVSVNYTPGNTYMTYTDGSMVQTTLTMSFSELEPIYDIDYKDGHKTGY